MYPFLINRTLEDDDTGEDSHEHLLTLTYKVLENFQQAPTSKELHQKILEHDEFDAKRHWRFNLNKLHQLLHKHYLKNEHLSSIEDIHKEIHRR